MQALHAKLDVVLYRLEAEAEARRRFEAELADIEKRLRTVEIHQGNQKGSSELVRWSLPILVTVAQIGFGVIQYLLTKH